MTIDDHSITTRQPLNVNSGMVLPAQASYWNSPFVGFKYHSDGFWNWAVVNNSNTPNLVVTYDDNVVIGSAGNNGNKLQVYGTGYFGGSIGIGTGTPSAQLHTTGSVRFAGLTADTTQTRLLVSDANGNLYYRDASTLASTDAIRTSLAGNWPDYVFAAGYRLPGLRRWRPISGKNIICPRFHLRTISEEKASTVARSRRPF
jgi:hypothetical protein